MNESGILPITPSNFVPNQSEKTERDRAARALIAAINKKLGSSPQKDIFLYVRGYNVEFECPVLTSKELQRYMGYRGAEQACVFQRSGNRSFDPQEFVRTHHVPVRQYAGRKHSRRRI